MKVTNSDTTALTGATQAHLTSAGSAASRSRTEAAGSSSDRVQLSSLSGHLRALSANSEARAQHLQGIETAVGSGHYRPDSSAVSAKIIEQNMRGESAA
jgi:anti-sigma28 factor (negative regulator of flagellin synthesis)